jgi:integrase
MFDLSNECALRREEVTHIKKKDFDFDEWEGGSLRLKVFAKGKERVVVVPSITARRVAKYVLKNAKKFTFEDPIFKIGIKRWHQVFKIAVRETTDHNYTLHDLRRRRATIWLDEGKDIDEVRRRLGHSSIATTQKYLIRSEEDRLEKWEEEN